MIKAYDREKNFYTPTWTDRDDVPELQASFFKQADRYKGATRKHRGRPKAAVAIELVKLRLDADVLAAFRASGEGWQSRINDTLRDLPPIPIPI